MGDDNLDNLVVCSRHAVCNDGWITGRATLQCWTPLSAGAAQVNQELFPYRSSLPPENHVDMLVNNHTISTTLAEQGAFTVCHTLKADAGLCSDCSVISATALQQVEAARQRTGIG
jgi:hypothetical protein